MNEFSQPMRSLKILSISPTFPSSVDPTRGIFVKERLKAIANSNGVEVRVLSPTPWFPPIRLFPSWYKWSRYPKSENVDGIDVVNGRYLLPPKVGGYVHPMLMHIALGKYVKNLREEFAFDLIDAHWVYPAGSWGGRLARKFDVPIVMTGRGEDLAKFPQLPLIGAQIRSALRKSDGCIAVSREIESLMHQNGATLDRTSVIPNGIDSKKFSVRDQVESRDYCQLPRSRKIVLSVGDILELKGFHLIVEAVARLRDRYPDILYVIVGGRGRFGRDYTGEVKRLIDENGIEDHVALVGPRKHDDLVHWYNSADLFAMMSSREGSPNALLESNACGTPVVGTAVGGVRDELADGIGGRLISERTVDAACQAISAELSNPRCRQTVARRMVSRSWEATADKVLQFFDQVISNRMVKYN